MKKFLKIGLTALSCACAFVLASCGSKENPLDSVVDYSSYPDIDMNAKESGAKVLSSVEIDTTNGKVNYYVGEKFTTEGMVFKVNYVQLIDGTNKGITEVVENYFYDDSKVDMNKVGTYTVEFKYREGSSVVTYPLEIKVTPSYLADLGVEYLAGLEPEETIVKAALNSTFNPKTAVTFKKKYMIGTDKGVVEGKVEEMTEADINSLEIDSSVNTAKKGKYTVYYTYETSVIRPDGSVYEYSLESFIVVIVE